MKLGWPGLIALALLAAVAPLPALAADAPADADSSVGKAGQLILDAAGGRTYIEAFAKTNSPTNPFGLDLAAIAAAIGAGAVTGAALGGVAGEAQLSILPQFNTPQARFGVSDTTPAVVPFAALVGGKCVGGYVTGYPAPDSVFTTDMSGRPCSAAAIEEALASQYPLATALTHSRPVMGDSGAASDQSSGSAAVLQSLGAGEPAVTLPDTSFTGATAPAPKGSDIDKLGQVILAAVDGRSVKQALDGGADQDNPFAIDADQLLLAAGVYFLSDANNAGAIAKSELSIFPDYVTPGDRFEANQKTQPIMPFAFNRGGICQGGYVTGYPVPDTIYAVDMHGKVCNAGTIDDEVRAAYDKFASESTQPGGAATPGSDAAAGADTPDGGSIASPADAIDNSVFDGISATDHDLEMIVYGAYTGAYNQALKHDNYFSSSELNFADLRRAIRDTLEKEGYGATSVDERPSASADVAKACATDGKIALRVAFNEDGVGISVVAVSATRMSAYEYFPQQSSDLKITHTESCVEPGASASLPPGGSGDRLAPPAH
ncbi:MAG: hypothetical protein P4M09_00755 [Devosia sp.]|nr:hypothetical protein [Devosia sp.]